MPIKILAVDDDPASTDLLRMTLTPHGFEVLPAGSGEVALNLLHEQRIDLLILDLMMPGMNGFQVCREARRFSRIPILVLSALDDPASIVQALDAGADDYLPKPVSTGRLIGHLTNLLQNHLDRASLPDQIQKPVVLQP